ncbi:MAG TPA: hypothetical protein VFQ63_04130 [Patescibacteria group bacterium]|nr:hypothetical protein [Patescibacteria group bacterium]
MNIALIGSLTFSKEMTEAKEYLQNNGHNVTLPLDTEAVADDIEKTEAFKQAFENALRDNVMSHGFKRIEEADAVLMLNYPKNSIDGYIGTSSLMELAIGYYLKKKLFLLFDIPHWKEASWAYEVKLFQPTILFGDLKKI